MAQRVADGDIPQWLTEPTLVFTYSLRGQMQDGSPGNRLPLLVEQTERWSKVVGGPITCLIISWPSGVAGASRRKWTRRSGDC